MKQDFTPIPPGDLVGLLPVKEQEAAINMHHQFRTNFMAVAGYRAQGSLHAARFAARVADARMEDLERLVMGRFMAEGPEIEAVTFRHAQARRVQS
ncbi:MULTISPECIES: hypothetical protein [Komagataeibacter]|uniref:Uncharacterized protein n=1 Tax=Komagataeibacter oboediens TaxID=65958 RepID=A0ABS5SQZ0_9PROT|nr:hypothetical protein [Komagataeibacter oboediens]MBL7233351.1 hypothetical protein [Komagataeibacter oboediens]MBT0676653.1 hypothetical protein [Komagataeibacter oboediens]MBT0678178.1 hypothetical protein [Komagataeibacter oboediens]